jgi:hypothetical protein
MEGYNTLKKNITYNLQKQITKKMTLNSKVPEKK